MTRSLARGLLMGLALASAIPACALELRLRERADVRGPTYTLGEIAEIGGSDEGTRARLAAVVIGHAPTSAQPQRVTREALGELLRHLDDEAGAPTWSGAAQVDVHARRIALDGAALVDGGARALSAAWAASTREFEPRLVGEVPFVSVPAGTIAMQTRLSANAPLAKRMLVHVDVTVDGRIATSVSLWFAVRALRPVRVARMPLVAGSSLDDASFTEAVRDVTAYPALPLAADAPLAGLRLRSALAVDAPLTAFNVEAMPAVRRNGPVRVQVQDGSVRLDTTGVALTDGRIGDRVRVINPASRDAFSAVVVADGAVLAGER